MAAIFYTLNQACFMKTSYNELYSDYCLKCIERLKTWPCYLLFEPWYNMASKLATKEEIFYCFCFLYINGHKYIFEIWMNEICFNCNECSFLILLCIFEIRSTVIQVWHPRWPPNWNNPIYWWFLQNRYIHFWHHLGCILLGYCS